MDYNGFIHFLEIQLNLTCKICGELPQEVWSIKKCSVETFCIYCRDCLIGWISKIK